MNAVVKGAKSGSGKTRTPVVAVDSAQSKTYIKLQYGLSEGEIEGLADGAKSIFLDDTPIMDDAGNSNFDGVTWDFRTGTNDQTYMEGFPEVSNDTDVNVELKTSAWVRSLSNTGIDAVRIRLRWGALRKTNASNGDVSGITIQYAIDVSTDGGAYVEALNTQISDKTSANYERSHRIDLPVALSGWNIRVRRLTPPADSDYVSDAMYVASYAEVIDAKFRYPNTALLGLQYDAENFQSIAKIAIRAKGIKVRVPSNYNPVTRQYVGIWDGSFIRAYSNNPAWIYYDLCTQKRYGLGERITDTMLDKASLYRLAQYCDGLVSDGEGGQEPRFTCNVYIQSAEDAYAILGKLAGVFRAISYWDGDSIICDADIPQDVYFNYTNANVVDGQFEYSGTRARDRHSVAKVAWSNPNNRFKTEYEIVRDENAIAKHGIKTVEIAAWGCTSRGQAQRAGLWAIRSEQYETQTASFKVGLDGNIPVPGKIISIADNDFAGRFIGGRIKAISVDRKTLTLDRTVVANVGDTIYVNGEQGQSITKVIQAIAGNTVTVTLAYAANAVAAQNAWTIDSSELATRKFRVMTIKQDNAHQFSITAVEYNPLKFDAIDSGAYIQNAPVSIINPTSQAAPSNVTLSAYDQVQQGVNIATMVIQWEKAEFAVKYLVEWKKDDGSWIKMPLTGNTSVEIAGIYTGNYTARVTAISAFDVSSLPTTSMLTALSGKQGLPPALAFFNASGILFGMHLKWGFPAVGALDTAYTEIQVSPDGISNIAQLGLFSYPTTTHTIQGLQPNLTQFYRGRLIDRIGNVGDWSNWSNATTSADASAVLDILSGKITESQLHQDLQTKVDKIELIETDLGMFDQRITDAQSSVDQANAAIATETQDRIAAILAQSNKLDQEIQNRIDDVDAETQARTQAITAETNARNTAILGEAQARSTAIATEKSERTTADGNLSNRIDTVSASSSANTAAIQQESTARANADNALSTRIDTVVAQAGQNTAAINAEAVARADGDSTNAQLISSVQTTAEQNNAQVRALILDESNSRIDADRVLSERVTGVEVVTAPSLVGSDDDLIGSTVGYVGAWSILTAVQEGDLYQAQRTDLLTIIVNENKASILEESTARITADAALVTQVNALTVEYKDNAAFISSQLDALSDADKALSTRIESVVAQAGQNTAAINSEAIARAAGDSANAQALSDYRASNDVALANVRNTAQSAVTASTSNTNAITALDGRVIVAEGNASEAKTNAASAVTQANTAVSTAGSASSLAQQASATASTASTNASNAVNTANSANTNANEAKTNAATALNSANAAASQSSANASQISAINVSLADKASTGALNSIQSEVDSLEGVVLANTVKIEGVFAQINPSLIGSTNDLIGNDAGLAGVWSEQSARIEEDMAQALRTDSVIAQMAANDAIYQNQIQANASAIAANVSATSTLQTTVGQNTASIQTQQQSINGINLQYTVKLDSNGYVSGFGQMNDGSTSNFIIRADKFAIAPPSANGNTPEYAFVYQASPVTLPNGTIVPAGLYLDQAVIGQISASKINATSLSAISANLGSITVGSANIADGAITNAKIANAAITTAKIGDLQVDTIKVKDNAVTNGIASQNTTSLTIVTDGGQVRVNVGINYYRSRQQQFTDSLVLYRDGVEIKRWSFSGYWNAGSYVYEVRLNQELPMIVDIVGAGTHTYSLSGLGTTSMALLEVKK